MPGRFSHYWPLDDAIKDRIWREGLIVPDANILLHVYRSPDSLRDELLSILEHTEVVGRLWIPNHVAEEFFRNRPVVITEQIASMLKARSTVKEQLQELEGELDKAIRKHHPYLDRESWKQKLQEARSSLEAGLESSSQDRTTAQNDPLLRRMVTLLEGHIGDPLSDDELKAAYEEAKRRIEALQPPGFRDKDKGVPGMYSDYVVWCQVLAEAAKQKRDVLLLTDDDKEDWWEISRGERVGPRPELRLEFANQTEHECDFASSVRFMEWARQHLGQLASHVDANDWAEMARPSGLLDSLTDPSREQRPGPSRIDDDDVAITSDHLVDWFFGIYEDPANGVPHESAEGGYQYVCGGPYDAFEELQDHFPEAPIKVIEEAAGRITDSGHEWVKIGEY